MHRTILLFIALGLIALAIVAPSRVKVSAQNRDGLVVIVGKSIELTNISLSLLRSAFQGEPATYRGDKRFVPLNQATQTRERELFDRKVLGLEPREVGRFWINRRIRDEGLPPRTLPSADLAPKVVASYPGAIAYVRASLLATSPVNALVRVLTVDGKAPSDPNYLFANP